ncbi:MAG: hypothetical protein WC966_02300 [Bradymonadales bacterium]|jgi:hypothetical protein
MLLSLCPSIAHTQDTLPVALRSFESEHFYVHYPADIEEFSRYVVRVAQEAHARLSPALEWEPREKTHLVVSAFSDDANGWALGVPYNLIHIYAHAPEGQGELGDFDDWVRQLVYHEYVHTLHIDTILGPHRVLNAIFGKFATNNATLPRWYVEGLAVLYETRFSNAGRLRSTLYKTMMRNAALSGTIPSLSQLSNEAIQWPAVGGSYLFGAYFLQYLAKTYGYHSLNEFHREYASQLIPYGINRIALRVWGKDWETLYHEWREYQTKIAREEARKIRAKGAITPQTKLNIPPHRHRNAKFRPQHPDEISFVYSSGHDERGIVSYHLKTGKRVFHIDCWGRCDFSWSSDGKKLYFTDNVNKRNKFQSYELFAYDTVRKKLERMTQNEHVQHFVIEKDEPLSFIYVSQSRTKIELKRFVPSTANEAEKIETLYKSNFLEPIDEILHIDGSIYAARFYSDTQSRDLARYELEKKSWTRLTNDKALELSPVLGPKDELYFVSDRSGEFNLYKIDANSQILRVTNLEQGILQTDYDPQSQHFVFTAYSDRGTNIHLLKQSDLIEVLAEKSERQSRLLYAELPKFDAKPSAYAFWRWIWPRSWFPSFNYIPDTGALLGLNVAASDPAREHSLQFAMSGSLTKLYHQYSLSYAYTGLSWSLAFSVQYLAAPSLFYDGTKLAKYDEGQVSSVFSASTYVFDRHTAHAIALGYRLSYYSVLSRPKWKLNPDNRPPHPPEAGFFNALWFSWTMSNVRAYEYSHSRAKGYAIELKLNVRAPWLGAPDYAILAATSARAYYSLPYHEDHKVALRFAAASSWSQAKRSNFVLNSSTSLDFSAFLNSSPAPALRGYPAGILQGDHYLFANAEYRFKIADTEWAYLTLPLQIRRISAAIFSDWAYAWKGTPNFNYSKFAVGAEIWLDLQLGYRLTQRLRIGYAWGASPLGTHQIYALIGQEF